MRVPFLASHALQIRYRGDDLTHKITVAGGDGTGGAALLTITDTTNGATAFDLGLAANDTGGELVALINALSGWEARLFRGVETAPILSTVVLSTSNLFNSVVDEQVGVQWQNILEYGETTDLVSAGTTLVVDRAMPVCVEMWDNSRAECWSSLAGAGTETITFELVSAVHRIKDENNTLVDLADSDWATISDAGTMALTSNGTTEVRKSFTLNNAGFHFIKIATIQNASAEDAEVGGFWSNGRESSL